MSNNRKRQSTNDSWRSHPYILQVPPQERETAKIIRESAKFDSHVKIVRNGLVTWDSRIGEITKSDYLE